MILVPKLKETKEMNGLLTFIATKVLDHPKLPSSLVFEAYSKISNRTHARIVHGHM